MLISHRARFIYCKTVKTAGTSVEVALEPFCLPDGPEYDISRRSGTHTPERVTEAGVVGARGPYAKDAAWFNHMPAHRIRARVGAETWDGYLKVANIRNPWDKTVSWYHFQHPRMRQEPRDKIVRGFRSWLATAEEIGGDFHVHALDRRPAMDVYLRYDTLAEDFAALCRRLDLPALPLARAKAEFRTGVGIDWRDYYDAEGREKVARAYAPEIDHFGWSFA